MKKVGKLYGKPVVEGSPNELKHNQILVQKVYTDSEYGDGITGNDKILLLSRDKRTAEIYSVYPIEKCPIAKVSVFIDDSLVASFNGYLGETISGNFPAGHNMYLKLYDDMGNDITTLYNE